MKDAIRNDVLALEEISIANSANDKKIRFLTNLLFNDYFDRPIRDEFLKISIEEIGIIIEMLNDYIIEANKRNVQTEEIVEGLIKKTEEGEKENVL